MAGPLSGYYRKTMKFIPSQLAYLVQEREARANLRALLKYLGFLAALVLMYTVLFHWIQLEVEGQRHSWITGLYWTLVVMTTLGLGDVTFTSDIGRAFSILVLMSGVIFLLVMLPFLFIRLFYAPWLEARVRARAPRYVPRGTTGHVIITEYDPVAIELVERLQGEGIPYFVIEPDPSRAARFVNEGIAVVAGVNDSRATYERLATDSARLLLANCEDTNNTNITLTAREVSAAVPIVAIVEEEESVDILELSGASTVLPLKHQLGAHLANRVETGCAEAHVIGSYKALQFAELPARDTPFAGRTVQDTRLRELTGVTVVGFWERGLLRPASPTLTIATDSVMVVAGTDQQLRALNALLPRDGAAAPPVLLIGAGKVGQAAARALKRRGLTVHVIDRSREVLEPLMPDVDAVFAGDAADRRLLDRAGIAHAASVLLTTNDDAMNIYLAVYCRRLNKGIRIVSRVTHERNVEAIHRAGADFVLSYTTLGVQAVMSVLRGYPPVLLGEGVELFSLRVPPSLAGRQLKDSGIGSRIGLSVVGLQQHEEMTTRLTSETVLPAGAELLMLGSVEQRRKFEEVFRS